MSCLKKPNTGGNNEGPGGLSFVPSLEHFFMDDFNNASLSSADYWGTSNHNGGSISMDDTYVDSKHPGNIKLRTGGVDSGSGINLADMNTGLKLGGGVTVFETMLYLNNLSTDIEEYALDVGTGDNDSASSLDHTNGFYFRYERTTSPNWITKTAKAGSRTATSTSVIVVTGEWIKLTAIVDANGASVEFFINGISVATHTTNIPMTTTTLDQIYKIRKLVGSSNRELHLDYHLHGIKFSTAR